MLDYGLLIAWVSTVLAAYFQGKIAGIRKAQQIFDEIFTEEVGRGGNDEG